MTKLYIHNIFYPDYVKLLKTLRQENEKNLNATLIVNDKDGVRTLPASDSSFGSVSPFPRSPLITFSESTLLIAGFVNNVYSSLFFEGENLKEIPPYLDYKVDMPSFIEYSAMNRKMNPKINESSYEISWPKYTLREFSRKINSVITKTKHGTIRPIKVYNCSIPFANRIPHRDNSLIAHNEVHLRVGMHNVRSIAIHSKDFGDYTTLANALKLHGIISTERRKILDEIDQPEKTGLNKCIDIEILKIKMLFQKFLMLNRNNRLNQLFPSYAENERMRASFASKKRKNIEFEIHNTQNQATWIEKQNDKISKLILELEEEMKRAFPNDVAVAGGLKEHIGRASSLKDLNDLYVKSQGQFKIFCDKIEARVKDKDDNPIKRGMIERIKQELEREVFFERYDPLERTDTYFKQIDMATALRNVDLAELIRFCFTKNVPDALLNLHSIMSKDPEHKKLLLQEFNRLNLVLRVSILKFIIINFINLDFLKEIIIEQENYLHFTNLIIKSDIFTNLDSLKKNQLIKFLINEDQLGLLFDLIDLRKIKIEEIRDQISQFSDLEKIEIIKRAINYKNLFFLIKLLEEKAIQDFFIAGVIANYSPENKKKIIKFALDNYKFFFVEKLLQRKAIISVDVAEVFRQYSIDNKENIIKKSVENGHISFVLFLLSRKEINEDFLIEKWDNGFKKFFFKCALIKLEELDETIINLVKNLLLKKIIEDSYIFFIPEESYFNPYFKNLNNLVSKLRMEGCSSLKEYLIKTKNYLILGYYLNFQYSLKSQESQELIRSLNFNELMQDALRSQSNHGLRLALLLISKYEIYLEKLNDGDFKKLICFAVKNDDLNALKFLLSKKNINNDELIDDESSLFDYSFSCDSKKILEFLIKRNPENAFQSSSAVIEDRSSRSISSQLIPQIIEVQDSGLAEPVRQQNNFDIILQPHRGNFSKITDSQIEQLVASIAIDEKKINLSNLLDSQISKTIAEKDSDCNRTNQKLIIFFKLLAIRNLANVEDIDLSDNKINYEFIREIILKEPYKNIFKRLKKLNLEYSLFLGQAVSINNFFEVIKNNIEDLNLGSCSVIAPQKKQLLFDNLMNCKNLKRLYFVNDYNNATKHYCQIIALNRLKELNIKQPTYSKPTIEEIRAIAEAFKENNTLQIFKINIFTPELIDVFKFNYTLLEIGLDSPYPTDLFKSKLKEIEERNARIFKKGEELFGKDNGIFLGQKLKEMQKKVERYIDDSPEKTRKLETIMDIVINELLELPRVLDVDNLMHKINEKNGELLLNDLQKTNLEVEFREIFLHIFGQDSKKRSQPASGLAQGGSASIIQRTLRPFSSQPLLQQPSSQDERTEKSGAGAGK